MGSNRPDVKMLKGRSSKPTLQALERGGMISAVSFAQVAQCPGEAAGLKRAWPQHALFEHALSE
jgi:hypothetical protein